jgi:hypothetical protein
MRVVVFDPYASAEVAAQVGVEVRGELEGLLPEVVGGFLFVVFASLRRFGLRGWECTHG